MPFLRPAEATITGAVAKTVESLPLEDGDSAAVRLALTYAEALDAGGSLIDLGPKLLAVLTALGATPAAREAALKGGPTSGGRLQEFRSRRTG